MSNKIKVSMDRFSENEVKEAFDNSPQRSKDFLDSDAFDELLEISNQYSLSEEDRGPLIKELGYLILNLTKEQNDYSELIQNNVRNID